MRCYFLVYQKDDHTGNDLTSKTPYEWLIQNRKVYENSELAVIRWMPVDVPEREYQSIQVQIGIEYDEERLKPKPVPEPIPEPVPEPEPEPEPIPEPEPEPIPEPELIPEPDLKPLPDDKKPNLSARFENAVRADIKRPGRPKKVK